MFPSDLFKMPLITMDPGLRGCGIAQFASGRLARAAYIPNTSKKERGPVAHAHMAQEAVAWIAHYYAGGGFFVVEFPQVYAAEKQKGDPNDLLEVAGVASAVTAGVLLKWPNTKLKSVLPREWKGSVRKDVMTARIEKQLAESERAAIVRVSEELDHNTLDGVGIGLAELGRLNERRYW